MEDIIIPKNQISVAKDVVTVESPELIEGLIKSNEKGLKSLETIGVKVNEISISKTGKLEFANKEFAEKIKKELERFKDEPINAICILNTVTCLPNTLKKCQLPLTELCVVANAIKICQLPLAELCVVANATKICDLPNAKIKCDQIPMTSKICDPIPNVVCHTLPGIPYPPENIKSVIK